MTDTSLAAFIWNVADLLRGDYKRSEYGRVILPFTVLRRLDCVLARSRPAVLAELARRSGGPVSPEVFLFQAAGEKFYNTWSQGLVELVGDADHLRANLFAYLRAFSANVQDILTL